MTFYYRIAASVGLRRLLTAGVVLGWAAVSHALVPFAGATEIFAGSSSKHTCAIVGGGAKCWGDNSGGQLGDGSTTQSLIPISVSGLTSGVTSLAVGNFYTCALVGGGVKCWGINSNGQLGDGTIMQRLTPVVVTGLASGVIAIAAGQAHTCALTSGGGVKCWGNNGNGQLGDNSTTQRLTPVNVSGLASGVVAIAAGQSHTCAVTSAGAVKCWGLNTSGQLGDNTIAQRITPTAVSGLTSGATAVAGGNAHTCALVSGGVKCWGQNSNGQLGDNSQSQRLTPVDVIGLTSGATAIVAGYLHSCARTVATGMQCWGYNAHGELGDSTLVAQRLAPVDVLNMTSGVIASAAGFRHTCAVTGGGAVSCWGDDTNGQLGDNATTQRLTPAIVMGQPSVKAMSGGGLHTCAIVDAGAVKCWGANDQGQLGDNSNAQRVTPVIVAGLAGGVSAVVTGASHSCALTTSGGVKCWGDNSSGQLGTGDMVGHTTPTWITGLATISSVSASNDASTGVHTCAVSGGSTFCTGDNSLGQLGDGTFVSPRLAFVATGSCAGVNCTLGITPGNRHTCGRRGPNLFCWGNDASEQLGDGAGATARNSPVAVLGGLNVAQAGAGTDHVCAVTSTGDLYCWGSAGGAGALGTGTGSANVPTQVCSGVSPCAAGPYFTSVLQVDAGLAYTCAVKTTGTVYCWGTGGNGQIGNGLFLNQPVPTAVSSLTNISAISVGDAFACGLRSTDSTVWCWGQNSDGQLGNGGTTGSATPVQVLTAAATPLTGVAEISAGGMHACARLTATNDVYCWGDNAWNQLGLGGGADRLYATLVSTL